MSLGNIYQSLADGNRLAASDALTLYQNGDILKLAELANQRREALHGDKTYFIRNKHIDYSNVCAIKCRFCAFARKAGEPDSFDLTIEQIKEKIRESLDEGIREVHIVGGFHPKHPFEFYTGMCAAIKAEFPQIHI